MALVKCVIYSISQDKIINYDYQVESSNLPIQGLDPDLKVYAYHIPFSEPTFDERLFFLKTTYSRIEQAHPTYSDLLTYQVNYEAVDLANTDKITSILNTENIQNENIIKPNEINKTFAKAIGLTYMAANGDTLTQNQIDFMNDFVTRAIKFWNNSVNADDKINKVNSSEQFDIDTGWEV
jgi:hypothetical protein